MPIEILEPAYLYADGTTGVLKELADAVRDPRNRARNAIVHMGDVPAMLKLLPSEKIKPVIDFPYGRGGMEGKRAEAERVSAYNLEGADIVVNLWAVQAGDWNTVRKEIIVVVNSLPASSEIKVITQTPFLWQFARDKIEPLAEVLGETGVTVWKDWTTVLNFEAKEVDVSDEARIAYTNYLREIIDRHNLPLLIKIAGKVREHNVVAFKEAGADMFGVGVPNIKSVLAALEAAGF